MFDRAVRRVFDDEDWFIADFKQERPDHRPDFLAMRDGIWLRVASRVALTCDSATNRREGQIYKTRERWEGLSGRPLGSLVACLSFRPTLTHPRI